MSLDDDLIEAYEVLSELTLPLCDACPNQAELKYRCCYDQACVAAEMCAQGFWNTKLEPARDPQGPRFLASTGCVVPPHLRPHCTGYLCPEALIAASPEAQNEYKAVRGYIERLELRKRSA